jgi:hypothetical protein
MRLTPCNLRPPQSRKRGTQCSTRFSRGRTLTYWRPPDRSRRPRRTHARAALEAALPVLVHGDRHSARAARSAAASRDSGSSPRISSMKRSASSRRTKISSASPSGLVGESPPPSLRVAHVGRHHGTIEWAQTRTVGREVAVSHAANQSRHTSAAVPRRSTNQAERLRTVRGCHGEPRRRRVALCWKGDTPISISVTRTCRVTRDSRKTARSEAKRVDRRGAGAIDGAGGRHVQAGS